jgi:hypothetical protein
VNAGATKYASATVNALAKIPVIQKTDARHCHHASHKDCKTLTVEDPVGRSRETDTLRTVLEREDF